MGVTAENVAERYGITRSQQDEFAVESQRRAAHALASGYYEEQIAPLEIRTRKGTTVFRTDEHVRDGVTLDQLGGMKPVFVKENGTVTPGNA